MGNEAAKAITSSPKSNSKPVSAASNLPVPSGSPEALLNGAQPFQNAKVKLDNFSKAVKAIVLITTSDGGRGSGSLVSWKGHLAILTNNHVLPSAEVAAGCEVAFRGLDPIKIIKLDPMELFETDLTLDYTLVGIRPADLATLHHVPPLLLSPTLVQTHQIIHILGHPKGTLHIQESVGFVRQSKHKELGLDAFVLYFSNTQPGSSGNSQLIQTTLTLAL